MAFEHEKRQITEACAAHGLRVRICYRIGIEIQNKFGFPPRSLVPTDPEAEDMTVFLWGEDTNRIYRVIAFFHSELSRLPLQRFEFPNREPFHSMPLRDFEQFRGVYCFESVEDFLTRFHWTEGGAKGPKG